MIYMCLYHRGERLQHKASTPSVCHLHVSWQFGEMFAAFALLSGAQAEAGRQPRLSHCCRLHLITWTPLIESCSGPYCIILLHCRWIKKVNCVCMCVRGCTGVILCVQKEVKIRVFMFISVGEFKMKTRFKMRIRWSFGPQWCPRKESRHGRECMFKANVIRQVDGVSIDFYIESSQTSCCVLMNARFLTAAALQTLCRCREMGGGGGGTVVTKLFICRFFQLNSRF